MLEKKYTDIMDIPFDILFKEENKRSEGYTLDKDINHRKFENMLYEYLYPTEDESLDTAPPKNK